MPAIPIDVDIDIIDFYCFRRRMTVVEESEDVHNKMHSGSMDVEVATAVKANNKLYYGFPRAVWIGTYVGSITFFVLNNVFTMLMVGFDTYPAIGIIPILIDILFIIPAFFIARKGLQETFDPAIPELPGSWNIWQLIWMSSMFYMGLLWGLQSLWKQAIFVTPRCQDLDGQTGEQHDQACSWAHHSAQFYLHAITGPIVLIASVFNFMKFSRGIVFDIQWHIWIGRLHNIFLLIATLGAVLLASVSATAEWIKVGFYILVVLWVPTMLMGWYHIRNKNIALHKRWMTRNFALTMCSVTLRLYNVFSLGNTPYYLMVYLSLIHPILLEIYLQYTDDCDRKWWLDRMYGSLRRKCPVQQVI